MANIKGPSHPTVIGAFDDFVSLLNARKYKEAFKALTEEYKNTGFGKRGYEDFRKSFFYTLEIYDLRYERLFEEKKEASYLVTYNSKRQILQYPTLDSLLDIPVEERISGESQKKITEFKKLMIDTLKADPVDTNNINDHVFFEQNNVENVLLLGGADYIDNNADLFKPKLEIERRDDRTTRADFIKTYKGWYINQFNYRG